MSDSRIPRTICLFWLFLFWGPALFCQNLTYSFHGKWYGKLSEKGDPVIISIENYSGNLTGTICKANSTESLFPIKNPKLEETQFSFDAPDFGGSWLGIIVPSSLQLTGKWISGKKVTESDLDLVTREFFHDYPNFSVQDVPYISIDAVLNTSPDGMELGATLTLPSGRKNAPAVIFVGADPNGERNEMNGRFAYFSMLSDYLTRQGIATIRMDYINPVAMRRGEAGSSRGIDEAAIGSAFEYLKSRPEINHKQIGVLSFDRGCINALSFAAAHKKVSFLVMIGAIGTSGREMIEKSFEGFIVQSDKSSEQSQLWREYLSHSLDLFENVLIPSSLQDSLDGYNRHFIESHSQTELDLISVNLARLSQFTQLISMPFVAELLRFDPSVYAGKVKCPIFCISGRSRLGLDMKLQIEGLESLFGASQSPANKVDFHPEMNHWLQTSAASQDRQSPEIDNADISPFALDLIRDFILKATQ